MFRNPYKDEDPKDRDSRLRARYEQLPKTKMSSWYSIFDLFHTAVDISISELFRSRLDRRMLQPPEASPVGSPGQAPSAGEAGASTSGQGATRRASHYFDYSQEATNDPTGEQAFWFDYAADVGDGFNSTYYVASLLAQPAVHPLAHDPAQKNRAKPAAASSDPKAKDAASQRDANAKGGASDEDKKRTLPRGRFLVLGGDEVYPSASRENYEDRFCRVYEAAAYADRPPSVGKSTHLYALPGNHDWYDGLASFMQVFGDERAIGQFRTRQRSSYFAIKLPHGFWIFAIDIGLWGELDRRQVEYFQDLAEHDLKDGERIILCIAEPDWVKARPNIENLRDGLFYFERRLAEALERSAPKSTSDRTAAPVPDFASQGAGIGQRAPDPPRRDVRVVLRLAGDLHHYRRHESIEPRHPTDRNVQEQDFVARDQRIVQNITAGGGGAFLHPTHEVDSDRRWKLAGTLANAPEGTVTQFPPGFFKIADSAKADQPIDPTRQDCLVFQCKAAFPKVEESRRLTRRNLMFGAYNSLFFLSLFVVFGGLLTLGLYLFHIGHHLWTALLLLLVTGGFIRGCQSYAKSEASGEIGESKQGRQRQIYRRRSNLHRAGNRGLLHGLAHSVNFAACLFVLAWVYRHHFAPPEGCTLGSGACYDGCMPILSDLSAYWEQHPSWPRWPVWYWLQEASCLPDFASLVRFLGAGLFGAIAALFSTLIFGVYLYLALNHSELKLHANGAFASLRIEDYKNFLRIKVTPQGLTVYPIGIRSVPKAWELRLKGTSKGQRPSGSLPTSLFVPVGSDPNAPLYDQLTQTTPDAAPFLIEPEPIEIPKADPPPKA